MSGTPLDRHVPPGGKAFDSCGTAQSDRLLRSRSARCSTPPSLVGAMRASIAVPARDVEVGSCAHDRLIGGAASIAKCLFTVNAARRVGSRTSARSIVAPGRSAHPRASRSQAQARRSTHTFVQVDGGADSGRQLIALPADAGGPAAPSAWTRRQTLWCAGGGGGRSAACVAEPLASPLKTSPAGSVSRTALRPDELTPGTDPAGAPEEGGPQLINARGISASPPMALMRPRGRGMSPRPGGSCSGLSMTFRPFVSASYLAAQARAVPPGLLGDPLSLVVDRRQAAKCAGSALRVNPSGGSSAWS
jgi:hypothetical protein